MTCFLVSDKVCLFFQSSAYDHMSAADDLVQKHTYTHPYTSMFVRTFMDLMYYQAPEPYPNYVN